MLELRQRLRGRGAADKLYWNHLERRHQHDAIKQVAALQGCYVVTVGSPVPQRRQERPERCALAA